MTFVKAQTVTYAQLRARIDPIADELERIAHRLRQGAISEELAAAKLTKIADQLSEEPVASAATLNTSDHTGGTQ